MVRGRDSASSTETIEKALRQIIIAQSGLSQKLTQFNKPAPFLRVIPVIITTAEMFTAEFDTKKVSPSAGTIQESDLTLQPLPFCAVTYHPDDTLSINRKLTNADINCITDDLRSFQTRTVFIVNTLATNTFLTWAADSLTFRP